MDCLQKEDNINRIKVIIIGGVHHNTLGVVRSIGVSPILKKNVTLLIIGNETKHIDFVSKSKYIDNANVYYLTDDKEIVPFLVKYQKKEKQAIICCSDGSAEEVLKNKHLLHGYICPSATVSNDVLFNKQNQSVFVNNVGMHIPKSMVINKQDISMPEWDDYPCIIKPLKSTLGGGKRDILIANSHDDLLKNINRGSSESFQIQKYIEKTIEFQLIGCSFEEGEQILIPGYTRILRQPLNTNTGYLEFSSLENINIDINNVKKVIRSFGYNGLFSMEFIRDKNDIDYYLETNFRNDGNAYCVKSAGINLPYIWCYYCFFKKIPAKMKIDFCGRIRFIPDLEDIKNGCSEVGVIKWLLEFFKADSHAVFSISDISPFLFQLKSRILAKKKK